jgi:hypothetical protein
MLFLAGIQPRPMNDLAAYRTERLRAAARLTRRARDARIEAKRAARKGRLRQAVRDLDEAAGFEARVVVEIHEVLWVDREMNRRSA